MNALTSTVDSLSGWIGTREEREDVATSFEPRALAALLNQSEPPTALGDKLAPANHWLYFLPVSRQNELSSDGHPARGGFLPPVELPRRMWAGGHLEFIRPIRVGDMLRRTSEIADIDVKQGRTGPLVFVKVSHQVFASGEPAVLERQDIVYRDAAGTAAVPRLDAPLETSPHEVQVALSESMLFRYSALTFNAHRIHYDRPYAELKEGYPGLVVHGPLQATLLMALAADLNPDATLRQFSFRGQQPLFLEPQLTLCMRPTAVHGCFELHVLDGRRQVTMTAEARFDVG